MPCLGDKPQMAACAIAVMSEHRHETTSKPLHRTPQPAVRICPTNSTPRFADDSWTVPRMKTGENFGPFTAPFVPVVSGVTLQLGLSHESSPVGQRMQPRRVNGSCQQIRRRSGHKSLPSFLQTFLSFSTTTPTPHQLFAAPPQPTPATVFTQAVSI
ncbi:hypothetical protein BU16DRAFT_73232 [Lophium mytilinum]|uniref:Uncharacterized protein n=1 Tax=Lophium mytilinum TaxID=390894 RepID=A0A6A6QLZ7_9PEZI|nr:hypothetical protein BU16DRAFT_73232 [Lophium mytilinum]